MLSTHKSLTIGNKVKALCSNKFCEFVILVFHFDYNEPINKNLKIATAKKHLRVVKSWSKHVDCGMLVFLLKSVVGFFVWQRKPGFSITKITNMWVFEQKTRFSVAEWKIWNHFSTEIFFLIKICPQNLHFTCLDPLLTIL